MAQFITVLIIAPCIILKINVFSRCRCVHVIISPGGHYLPRLPWMCNLVHIQGETHHSCCHCEHLVPFSRHGKCQSLCLCSRTSFRAYSQNKHEHVQHWSRAQKTFGQQLFLKPKWLKEFYTAVSSSSDTSSWLPWYVCRARKGECSLGMAPIQPNRISA